MEWIVVTPDNIDEVWQKMKDEESNLVLFALTDQGYEQLALTIAEIRNFINSQRIIIMKYKEYYEPEVTTQEQKQ